MLVHRQVGGGIAGLEAGGAGRAGEQETEEQQRGQPVRCTDDDEDGTEGRDAETGGQPGPSAATVGDADQGQGGERGADDARRGREPCGALRPGQAGCQQTTHRDGCSHPQAAEHLRTAEHGDGAPLDREGRRSGRRTGTRPDRVGGHPIQRSLGGRPSATTTARHTSLAGSPAASAWSTVRPPSPAMTTSCAHDSA